MLGQIMQPFPIAPSSGQYELPKNTSNDDGDWTLADEVGTFEEGKIFSTDR